jgi:hypothetical protein
VVDEHRAAERSLHVVKTELAKGGAAPRRNSETMMSSAFPTHGTTAAQAFIQASLSSSMSTWAWALGSVKRRSFDGLAVRQRPAGVSDPPVSAALPGLTPGQASPEPRH